MVSSTSFTAPASNRQVVQPAQDSAPTGLTNEEARTRLAKDGPNAMPTRQLIHCAMHWLNSGRRYHGCLKRPLCLRLSCISITKLVS